MNITIHLATDQEKADWDKVASDSPHGTLFHCWDWLKIVEKHTGSMLHPLFVYRGADIVAIYPLFLKKKGPINLALSPPSHAYLLYLGPVFANYHLLKQDKKESLFIHVQDAVDRYLLSEQNCKYIRIRTAPSILDSRPLRWAGYSVEPLYTYRIDLSQGIETVWKNFDRKLRVELNKADREGVEVREGGKEDIRFITDSLSQRFQDQGFQPREHLSYLDELFDAFSPTNMRVFTAWYEGDRVGGMIALGYKEIMALWTGVSKSKISGISPNDRVQWEAIQWACSHGYRYYEEMDAGTEVRLRSFKSKYNPELAIWYSATKYASPLYKLLRIVSTRRLQEL